MLLHLSLSLSLCSVLASLNLPAAIEDLSGSKVPQSVLEKAAKVRDMGGIAYLSRLMTDLPESLTRNKEILDEVSITRAHGNFTVTFTVNSSSVVHKWFK